jgi:H/ACA ribonucleoprotein complex subunit 1
MSRGFGNQRGGRGGYNSGRGGFSQGPPDTVIEMGTFLHACEGEMVCKSTNEKIPYFNAPIYLSNKTQIGKVEEILGPLNEVYFSVKMQDGMVASSFKIDDKVYIASDKLLPLERFLPKPVVPKEKRQSSSRGRGGAVSRGGRGGSFGRGGRGGSRGGASRGGGQRGGFRGGFSNFLN